MPVQEVITAINSTINSILSCSLVYLHDITPGQQLPLKKNRWFMKNATPTSGIPLILIIILYSIIFLTSPCPYQLHLHYWTPFLNNRMSPCISPEKFRMSQQASKVASLAHAVLPHAPVFLFLLGTSHYTQLQESDQDCLGTSYDTI